MKPLGPDAMRRILAVTDALGIHRESVRVPLARRGGGSLRVTPTGQVEIVAPEEIELEVWLAQLPARIGALDLSGVRRAE